LFTIEYQGVNDPSQDQDEDETGKEKDPSTLRRLPGGISWIFHKDKPRMDCDLD